MDTLCRICIEQMARCTSLSSKIENSSNKSYFDFLNKCSTLNARESDSLPQSLCSVCANAMKKFYSFMKLAEKSDLILREALRNLISEGRYNGRREIPCGEIAITKKIEEEYEDFNKEGSFHCQPSKNSTEKQLCMLDIVKKESRTTESTSIVDLKGAEIIETEKLESNLDHSKGDIKELDDILFGIDHHLISIDTKHDSEDDVPISLLKSRLAKVEEDSFHCQPRKNSTESASYILDFVKEEPGLSESTSFVAVKDAEIDEGESNLYHPEESIEEPDDILSRIDRLQASIDIEHTDSEDDMPSSTLKRKFAKSEDEADYQSTSCEETTERKKTIRHGCKICGKKFKRKSTLKVHFDNHKGIRPKCDQCGMDFQSMYTLSRHLKWHANPKPFKCENCGQLFCRKDRCVKHTVICKRRSKLQQFKTPESISALKTPELKTPESISILKTPESISVLKTPEFKTPESISVSKTPELKTPESISVLKTSENDCGICGKKFSRKDYLDIHMQNHMGIIPKCDICGKVFEHGYCLNRHMKMHNNPKRFNCGICGKSLSSFHSRHMEICKPPGEPFIQTKFDCELCGKKFNSKYYLRTHMDSHMGIIKKCDQCGKEFKHGLSFSRHMRWHKNPRPFQCEYCGKSLARRRSYDTHKKICKLADNQQQLKTEPIHTEEKKQILSPAMLLLKNAILRGEWDKQTNKLNLESHNGIIYKCDQCGKKFKTSLALGSHKERLSQSCENCGELFAWKCTYTRHAEICKGPGQPKNTYMDIGHKDICKPIDNSIDDTVTTEDPHLHWSGNNDIVEIT